MKKSKIKQTEIEKVLDRLHLGIHSGDGIGINRLHWIGFVDFIIKNPENLKRELVHKLISVLCVKERTVMEYVNCAVAWNVLRLENGMLIYIDKDNNDRKEIKKPKQKKEIKAPKNRTDEEILRSRTEKFEEMLRNEEILESKKANHG